MDARAVVDTGYLVALLNGQDDHHDWAVSLLPRLRGPWLTAEACVSEAVFLLEQAGRAAVARLLDWLDRGALVSRHLLPEELEAVRFEMLRYRERRVDFADACVLTLSDARPKLPVVTVDARDFAVYFRHRRGRRLLVP
ncbi:MAG: type II toxin-antitoxin system VapC family toxin, partial [Polyangiaceae bacterium]